MKSDSNLSLPLTDARLEPSSDLVQPYPHIPSSFENLKAAAIKNHALINLCS
jgi:hypothetical protein